MKTSLFEILRCPYCGGTLELVESIAHQREGDEIEHGVIACHCCTFPVVAGIPVMYLGGGAVAAREEIEAGRPAGAVRAMLGVEDDARAARFQALMGSPEATYQELVESLGTDVEGGYFLYRFSDPSYVVASAVMSAVAGTVLKGGGRAIDVCGGSGHLTRTLLDLSSLAPVIADLYFTKLWLAAHVTAPGSEPVCCDGNAPLPFARGAFSYAMCADAFMFIWTKRQLVGEMARVIDREGPTALVISHTHNERQWSPSWGSPLPPDGYRDLFETMPPRVFSEAGLLSDLVKGGPLDLSRRDDAATLDADPALTIVASRDERVYRAHTLEPPPSAVRGELRLNPLYEPSPDGDRVRLRLRFPSEEYEDEYGACRLYLAEEVLVDRSALERVLKDGTSAEATDLIGRRVVLDLPKGYY